jgi:hypothetical protein
MKSSLPARTSCRLLASPCRRVQAKAVSGMYNHIKPNFDFIEAVLAAFPEDAVASPDEARVCIVLVRMTCYALMHVGLRCLQRKLPQRITLMFDEAAECA